MILTKLLQEIMVNYHITADHLIILECLHSKNLIFLQEFLKIEKQRIILLQNLVRRGYLSVYDEELNFDILENLYITDKAEEIITLLKNSFHTLKVEEITFTPTSLDEKFSEFWELFPSSDKYMHFPRTRVLKNEQDKCKKIYRKLLDNYKHEDIITCLKYEISMRENNSITGMNKPFSDFKYMKASPTWLNNKEFLAISELMKDDSIEKEDPFSKVN